ncbi:uncharacterized protein LOC128233502 [Mya arenaria]|uniref:uncharacterized protein LOC128233502 n=1 Tax=Mya arenaria TaxID=6604 RepID=UPI0022E1DE24|nr:uncharacterized protein LOC128233502 [Mya arenaria]
MAGLNNETVEENATENTTEVVPEMYHHLTLYIGVSVGAGIAVCLIIILAIVCYKRRLHIRYGGDRRSSSRRLFLRGFSTVSQRGVIDSTAEFEISNIHGGTSVSSSVDNRPTSGGSKSGQLPKKPLRKKTRTSSSAVRYENVAVDPKCGIVVKSTSLESDIPYMDRTLESRLSFDGELHDEVFE